MFSRSEASTSVSQRVSTIEAWLNEQPDPFLDHHLGRAESPVPLKKKGRRRSKKLTGINLEGSNQGSEGVEPEDKKQERKPSTREGRRERRSRTSRDATTTGSLQAADVVQETEHVLRISPKSSEKGEDSKANSHDGLKSRVARASRARTGSAPVDQTIHEDGPPSRIRQSSSSLPQRRSHAAWSRRRQPGARGRSATTDPPPAFHCLSTIASVETFQLHADKENQVGPAPSDGKGLQRRLTTHEDLMSVLSLPRTRGSIKSARSVRTTKTRISAASVVEVFEELGTEEARYMRELKTLVDGVIPVLLQCVLSKSDSAAAAGLFSSSASARDDLNFTKPIVGMGVALERLKTLHRRIPTHDLTALLTWAHSAHKVYVEYLKAWRLGFQDVVINLAPPDEQTRGDVDQGMARDQDGDVINSRGEKVDVAYLLKRPLVRIKNLAKVFSRLKMIQPSSKAAAIADQYEDLIKTARKRSNEEQSRLEDEAAANIDATKARDLHSLAVLSGVIIDKSRRVRARDCFSLTVHHSSGQRLDCQIELLLRDNPAANGGDLLVCEVENRGRWLLFPPLETGTLSARRGDSDGETVVMIRRPTIHDNDRHELLLLRTNDIDATSEWVNMLGSDPPPPQLNRGSSFASKQCPPPEPLPLDSTTADKQIPMMPRSPRPKEVEIPLGEPSNISQEKNGPGLSAPSMFDQDKRSSEVPPSTTSRRTSRSEGQVMREAKALRPASTPSPQHGRAESLDSLSGPSTAALRRSKVATRRPARHGQGTSTSPHISSSSRPSNQPCQSTPTRRISRTDQISRDLLGSSDTCRPASSGPDIRKASRTDAKGSDSKTQRPEYRRTKSSTPSKELPTIPRLRPSSLASTSLSESTRERWSAVPSEETISPRVKSSWKTQPTPSKPPHQAGPPRTTQTPITDETAPPLKREPHSPSASSAGTETLPIPPPHRTALQKEPLKPAPVFKAQSQPSSRSAQRGDRRSSSPLKHQYAPSTTSESDESSDSEESITSSTSDTSEGFAVEPGDQPLPVPPLRAADLEETARVAPPASLSNLQAGTLAPSNSASQAPYRTVPHPSQQSNAPLAKKIATVCAWSEAGLWESLHAEECSIVVSPGLIEAYEMSAAHSRPQPTDEDGTMGNGSSCEDNEETWIRPLVGFELTPLVPLRRGTALDISIRSPPTRDSKIQTTTNIMFRSRNAQECEQLYAMINFARINNPTWIALEKARPKEVSSMNLDSGRGSARHSRAGSKYGSWFGFGSQGRKASYRASSTPRSGSASIAGASESSVGSMSSALSALRRFSGAGDDGKKRFNLNRSSVLRKRGPFGTGGSNSLYSSSSGTTRTGGSGSGAVSPALSQLCLTQPTDDAGTPAATPAPMAPAGTVNNVKVRLYTRESAARWRDLGSGRLCVLPAPAVDDSGNADATKLSAATDLGSSPPGTAAGLGSQRPLSTASTAFAVGQPGQPGGPRLSSSNHTPHRVHGNGNEKRILITGKTKGEALLDATLHESCFERIARTGIAISVWEERAEVAKIGGVVGGKAKTYMMQMRGEAEASWVFGLVGRLRY